MKRWLHESAILVLIRNNREGSFESVKPNAIRSSLTFFPSPAAFFANMSVVFVNVPFMRIFVLQKRQHSPTSITIFFSVGIYFCLLPPESWRGAYTSCNYCNMIGWSYHAQTVIDSQVRPITSQIVWKKGTAFFISLPREIPDQKAELNRMWSPAFDLAESGYHVTTSPPYLGIWCHSRTHLYIWT